VKFLEENEIDTIKLKEEIEAIIVKSLISVEPTISNAFNSNISFKNNCFEL